MSRQPVLAYVGLGANLGDPVRAVRDAITRIAALSGVALQAQSSLYCSAPVDASGPDFINAVVALRTTLSAPSLLDQLRAIESDAGRQRPYVNAPRTLDLDLLLYGDARIDSPSLTVPHPRMWQRAFVLLPLAELASHLVSPHALAAVAGQGAWRIASEG